MTCPSTATTYNCVVSRLVRKKERENRKIHFRHNEVITPALSPLRHIKLPLVKQKAFGKL